MFTTASAENRIVNEVLDITYEKTRKNLDGTAYWLLTRRATKSYEFVDMRYFSAMAEAKRLVAKYTRTYDSVLVEGNTLRIDQLINLTSEIFVERDSPISYKIRVKVNEVDERFSLDQEVEDIAAKFADLAGRDYDETASGEGVALTRIVLLSPTSPRPYYRVFFDSTLEENAVYSVQLKDSESANWRNFSTVAVAAKTTEQRFTLYVDQIGDAHFVRLFDGLHESNILTF